MIRDNTEMMAGSITAEKSSMKHTQSQGNQLLLNGTVEPHGQIELLRSM